MPRRHVDATGQRLDVERLRILAVDAVPHPAQPNQILQVRARGHERTRVNRCNSHAAGMVKTSVSTKRVTIEPV